MQGGQGHLISISETGVLIVTLICRLDRKSRMASNARCQALQQLSLLPPARSGRWSEGDLVGYPREQLHDLVGALVVE